MGFMHDAAEVLDNTVYTENGASGYKTTGDELVDFLYKISSFRNETDEEILNDFYSIKDSLYVLKLLFYIRDCRGGLGERHTFRVCLKELLTNISPKNNYEEFCIAIFDAILKYGRADDLFYSIDFDNKKVTDVLKTYLENKILEANKAYDENKPLNIIFKWFPSENTSSKQTRDLAKKVRKLLNLNSKDYRKMLSKFRTRLNITEAYMCANRWNEIDYNKVPSKANLIYSGAFYRHDTDRRQQYLDDLAEGKETIKINSRANYPYEIFNKYINRRCGGYFTTDYNETLEQLWKNLKKVSGLDNTMVICDGSGSMNTPLGKSKITALDVSRSLAIYCSQYCQGEYKDKFITFGSTPKLVDLGGCKSLFDKIRKTSDYDDCSNTDIEKVFDLVLKTAIRNNCKQGDLPKQLLIISDMEFDEGTDLTGNPIESAQEKYKRHGYDIPRLVFWNVCSRTKSIPVQKNNLGVLLVSGFSQNVIDMVNNGETDPKKALIKELEKYDDVPLKN